MLKNAFFILCIVLSVMLLPVVDAQSYSQIDTLADFEQVIDEIRNEINPTRAQGRVDAMWELLLMEARIPLVFPNGDVVFMYRGDAETVEWRGDFSLWQSNDSLFGERVADTDLWVMRLTLPEDARIEYKIVLNGDQWVLDPSNLSVIGSGSGPNSELRMPAFTNSDWTDAQTDVPHGDLSEQIMIESTTLDYTLSYWVYTPPGYDDLHDLTTVYVLDGNDYIAEMKGRMPYALDNLIDAGEIHPPLVVFINARDPFQFEINRREREFLENDDYARFIATELVPAIDAEYRTNADRNGRILMGTSFGGLASAYITSLYPEVFGQAALFSPSLWAADRLDDIDATALGSLKVFICTGYTYWDVGDLTDWVEELRQFGFEVNFYQTMEGHSWETWRAQLDEMLLYFLSTES